MTGRGGPAPWDAGEIRQRKVRTESALNSALKTAHSEPFNFDYDIDRRWGNVIAFTTYVHKGRRYKLSIAEESD